MRCKEASKSSYVQRDFFTVIEEAYLEAATKISQTIEEIRSTGSLGGSSGSLSVPLQPQLPKIQLPTFSGNPLDWESFRDLFKSLVHDAPHLSDLKKLLYLKSSLSGEPAEVIQNTPITEAGYTGAWEDLEVRYGNARILSFAHHCTLLSCPAAQRQTTTELEHLLDTFRQTIRAYSTLKKPVSAWDEWFVYLLSQKLDRTTHLAWETSLVNTRKIPSFQQLADFLENRIQALDAALITDYKLRPTSNRDAATKNRGEATAKKATSTVFAASTKTSPPRRCLSCGGAHCLNYCSKFKTLSPPKRRERAIQLKACLNCLRAGHDASRCLPKNTCLACGKHHHTLLHDAMAVSEPVTSHATSSTRSVPSIRSAEDGEVLKATSCTFSTSNRATALLATARVKVESPSGEAIEVHALLDTGSDTSLISNWVAQALRLPRRAVQVATSGVQDNKTGTATSELQFSVRSLRSSDFSLPVRALVLRRLTSVLPAHRVDPKPWTHLQGINLADPDFGVPARVDLILGADVCGSLFQDATQCGQPGTPTGKLTPFGWVLMGTTSSQQMTSDTTVRVFHCRSEDITQQLLQRFWELEEVKDQSPLSPDEERCEQHFRETHTRDTSGRYCVRLPFKRDPNSALEPSRTVPLRLLLSSERRLVSNTSLAERYSTFMKEYLSLRHMEPVSDSAPRSNPYYLPHHAVVKRHDPAAKLRVVFNASFPTPTGTSLNDCLFTGPKLQADLWLVLTRWRLFRVVFTADIVKMSRQIRVHHSGTNWQRILWRPQPGDPLKDCRLTTVTYGTSCAPFLALRVLAQLAEDEWKRFPLGAIVINRHTYVDDILAGADDEEQLEELGREVISIFEAGAFRLSKWASNSTSLQGSEQSEDCLFQETSGIGTLGVLWSPTTDSFSLRVSLPVDKSGRYSKRRILSEVASLFDPLGWAAPVIIHAKVLIQDLWFLGVDWDQELPQEIQESWVTFKELLPQLDSLTIPRWTHWSSQHQELDLHGFCDASQRAYGAAVYLRVVQGGATTTTLLVAKTKVAPVKTVTIPRLELCGAVLLAKLITQVKKGLDLLVPITAWTDSTVVLHWIQGHASLWKPFVAHRVAAVQSRIPPENWRHIRTSENPADLATRSITPAELQKSNLWWTGPH